MLVHSLSDSVTHPFTTFLGFSVLFFESCVCFVYGHGSIVLKNGSTNTHLLRFSCILYWLFWENQLYFVARISYGSPLSYPMDTYTCCTTTLFYVSTMYTWSLVFLLCKSRKSEPCGDLAIGHCSSFLGLSQWLSRAHLVGQSVTKGHGFIVVNPLINNERSLFYI